MGIIMIRRVVLGGGFCISLAITSSCSKLQISTPHSKQVNISALYQNDPVAICREMGIQNEL